MTSVRVARAGRGMLGQRSIVRVVSAGVLLFATASAGAQWSVTNLNPLEGGGTFAYSGIGQTQAGEYTQSGFSGACLWNGSAASWRSIHPAGATWSRASGVDRELIGGFASFTQRTHAVLWNKAGTEWTDLNPPSQADSRIYGVGFGIQVGSTNATHSSPEQAAMWSGTTSSWTSLHPDGALRSVAAAVSGEYQAGQVTWVWRDGPRAALWAGTSASVVDLNPEFASESQALAIAGGAQGGYAILDHRYRAALWRGSAASFVNLHPSEEMQTSRVLGMGEGYEVGFVSIDNEAQPHASIWSGTADSWIDLHALLDPVYIKSTAYAVWRSGDNLYVAGCAVRSMTYQTDALIWSMPIPAPGAAMPLAIAAMVGMRRVRRRAVKAADAATLQCRAPTID